MQDKVRLVENIKLSFCQAYTLYFIFTEDIKEIEGWSKLSQVN